MTPSKALVAAAAQFRKCICLTFGIVAIVQEICKYLSFLITLVGPELEEKNTIKSHKPLIDNLRRKNNFKVVVLQCNVLHKCGHAMVAAKRGGPTSSPPLCSSQLRLDFTKFKLYFILFWVPLVSFACSFGNVIETPCHQLIL